MKYAHKRVLKKKKVTLMSYVPTKMQSIYVSYILGTTNKQVTLFVLGQHIYWIDYKATAKHHWYKVVHFFFPYPAANRDQSCRNKMCGPNPSYY